MPNDSSELQGREQLLQMLLRACEDAEHEVKTLFGCKGVFRESCVFGLIWKSGRIALKLPDIRLRKELLNTAGAEPWTVGNKTMKEWVLVPEQFHRRPAKLRHWTLIAYSLATHE